MVTTPKIAVVGAGWVGILTAVTLVRDGFSVVLVEVNAARVQELRTNRLPFFEPGLPEAWAQAVASGRLTTVQNEEYACGMALAEVQLAIICVYTPSLADGGVDTSGVEQVAGWLTERLPEGAVVAVKSTVPPGSAERVQALLGKGQVVAANPEFLAESTALTDAYQPERVLLGYDNEAARPVLEKYATPYAVRGAKILWMSTRTAEMAKYASNTFLLVKVSYANELAQIAEASGADPSTVMQAVGLDSRIGDKFLRYGLGWGGGCFPKDIRGLQAAARGVGAPTDMLNAALKVNYGQVPYYMAELKKRLGHPLADQHIAVLGLSFKPGTDDTRSSPSLRLIHALLGEGAHVTAYDPQVKGRLAADFKEVKFTDSLEAALQGTEAALIATAWPDIKAWAQNPQGYQGVVLDCRP